ncbi:MAG: cytochrome P460 [Gemmatimonadales bacterium]|nr:hypothetical protein HRbin33_01501 [bacterium HR33]GIW53084.1 MAG: cytochrome P460 [Gemmatimonadales bacterium]GIW53089.1 MAG: cytochrome P460 [Gemmatimonadales bacterium]
MKGKWLGAWGAVVAAGVVTAGAAQNRQVSYPEGYRSWQHVKSMVILPGHPLENPFGGIHHVYANSRAVEGLRTGSYPDGAVLVFDLLEAKAENHTIQEGPRKLVGVMERDSRRFAATGGWGFEGFAGDSKTERLVKDGGQSCFQCHQGASATSYVFSALRP